MNFGTHETHPSRSSGRTLHLVDVENLTGDPRADGDTVAAAIAEYRSVADARDGDLAVLATNGRLAVAAGRAWPGALLRVARGPNGADLALLDEADPVDVAERFDRVVLGSGDGIFAITVRELRLRGREVLVVGRIGTVSRRLARIAEVRYIGVDPDPASTATRAVA